uniref:Neur_chan_LBD domain-containing protein n=1 Tax=Steinernema glaseri TaxID=37863 RepID=A0A1I7YTV7_9BILA
MVVYSTGEVNWIPPGIFRASCKIDITWFPFDEQSCYLKFGSWTYNGNAIDLHLDHNDTIGEEPSIDLSTYIPSGEWLLTSAPAVREESYYNCCPEPYPTIKFFLNLRRRTLFYTFNLIIPSLLVALMTLLAFCLPAHDMSEKIGTQTTILLSVCFFLTIVSEMTPPTSEAVPLLGVFFSTLTLIVAISTAFTIAVMNLRYRQPTNHHMREWFRNLFLVWLPWILLMKRPGYKLVKVRAVKIKNGELKEKECVQCIGIEEVDQDSDDGLSTAILDHVEKSNSSRVSSMPSPTLSLDRKVGQGIFTQRRSIMAKQKKSDLYERYIQRCIENIHEKGAATPNVLAILEYYKCMQTGLKFISERMNRHRRRDDTVDEYRFASMVLDRFCLMIFTVFIAISITVLFSSAPYLYA